MSLSKEPVFSLLHNRFVCGYKDIANEPYAGNSGAHSTNGNAVDTTNGAGPHNIQLFVMDPDGTVLHCLPGFWNPTDLAGELQLAERLGSVWKDRSITSQQKNVLFARMQMEHFKQHSKEMVARSHMQSFDRKHELEKRGYSDTLRSAPNPQALSWHEGGDDLVKTTDEIMHERMSKRPFLAYNNFDTARFADYGTHFYDKHEDSLDENGRNTDPESRAQTMRDLQPRRRHNMGRGRHTPQLQVKTYGQLRSNGGQ